MLKRKSLVVLIALLLVLPLTLFGCGNGAVDEPPPPDNGDEPPAERIGEGRTLVVGIWGGPQEDLIREYVVRPFEEQTGATVELILGGTSDRFARIYAEVDNPTMDIVYMGLDQTMQAAADEVIQEPNPAGVPEFNNLYPQAQATGGYGVAFLSIGIMYNTDAIDTPPTSWLDMWDPAYSGKVAPFVFPGTQGSAFLNMAARVHGGDENNIDPGFEAIKELKPFPAILSGVDETNLAFQQGDVWLAPQIHGLVHSFRDEGGPVDFVIPEEGAPLAINSAMITKNSPNTDLAEIFINMHLGQVAQEAFARDLYYAPTNRTVVLDEELASRMPYGEDEVNQLLVLDSMTITANAADWADRWNREILD